MVNKLPPVCSARARGELRSCDEPSWRSSAVVYAIFAVAAVFCFCRSYFYEPISDDLIYGFFLDEGFGSKYYSERIAGIWDVLRSQYNEWFNHSGRFLVHTITQMFAGVWGRTWFSVFNAIVFFLTALCFYRYIPVCSRGRGWLAAMIIVIVLMYICPAHGLWVIAVSLNYLWPMPVVICYLMVLKKLISTDSELKPTLRKVVLFAMLGFLAGLTQEVFILPLCIATFIIFVRRIARRRRIGSSLFALMLGLWFGSALVGLAPGTLSRGGGLMHNPVLMVYVGLKMLLAQKIFWCALIAVLVACVKKRWRDRLIVDCRLEFVCIAVAVVFAVIAHTTNNSFIGLQFYSFLLLLMLPSVFWQKNSPLVHRDVVTILSGVLFLVFVFHQVSLIIESDRFRDHNHSIIEKYIESPDGIVVAEQLHSHWTLRPYMRDFVYDLTKGQYGWWEAYTIQVAYGSEDKKIRIFSPEAVKDLAAGLSRTSIQRIPGTAGFSRVDWCIAASDSALRDHSSTIVVRYARADMSPDTLAVDSVELMATRWGDFRILHDSHYKKITSVDLIK